MKPIEILITIIIFAIIVIVSLVVRLTGKADEYQCTYTKDELTGKK